MNIKSLQKFIFPVGIYYGLKKPTTSSSFLDEFVTEAVDLSANGFLYKGKTILLKINSFVCDAPAKSFILGMQDMPHAPDAINMALALTIELHSHKLMGCPDPTWVLLIEMMKNIMSGIHP
uniref:Uncharacterized protein n=1 Tax=Cacopsylla melanoneura TaxID=428564 RepID=A0A8D9FA00_9HEMI